MKWKKVGDIMLIGEYHHNIDEKGRLIIPSKFREDIGNEFVVTRGLDGCLFVYAMKEWNAIVSKLRTLPFTKKDARTFNRFFMSSASTLEFDKQGRINIPSSLTKIYDNCFLPFKTKRIKRIQQIKLILTTHFLHDSHRIIKISCNFKHICTIGNSLREFA